MLWGIVAGWAVVASALQAGSAVTLIFPQFGRRVALLVIQALGLGSGRPIRRYSRASVGCGERSAVKEKVFLSVQLGALFGV